MVWLAILAGAIALIALVLLVSATLIARVSRRRHLNRTHHDLASIRGPSGQPFFPESKEDKRREERILVGWDPTYGDAGGTDPDRW
jgi:hypothetical protein